MRFKYTLLLLNLVFSVLLSFSQSPTIGLLYEVPGVTSGYALFTPEKNDKVFLIDECGQVVNEWLFSEKPGLTCYFLPNGNLLRVGQSSLEIRDWDNNLTWSYSTQANGILKHHDIEPLPNGNILLLVRDIYTEAEVLAIGGDSALSINGRNFEKVIEIQPIGTNQASIVWEWKFKDHLIQDYDSTKPNYGVIGSHPELMNMNYDNGYTDDPVHVNAVDYNAELDQVLITARHMSELYIIDHSTTAAQAASHSGGNSGKGGDFLWRWGNPEVYQPGLGIPQKIFLPHDGKWVESTYADSNKISVFNNRGDGSNTFSSIHLVEPVISAGLYQMGALGFAPTDFDWSWTGDILGTTFYESKKSGTHALPNGNMMICETGRGRVTEVAKNGDVVWVYISPSSGTVNTQYSNPYAVENFIFRAEKYPPNYPGFVGKDLTPTTTIEDVNLKSDTCNTLSSVSLEEDFQRSIGFVQPATDGEIVFSEFVHFDHVSVFNMTGELLFNKENFEGNKIMTHMESGVYLLNVSAGNIVRTYRVVHL